MVPNAQAVEGTPLTFVFFRNQSHADEVWTVNLEVTETGDTFDGEPPMTVEFGAGSNRAELVILTDKDEEEDNSVVTVKVVDGDGYLPGLFGTNIGTVTVTDGDGTDVGPVDPGEPVPDPTLPGVPQRFDAEAGDHMVTLTWQAPATGDAPTGYEYKVNDGQWLPADGMTEHVVRNLDNGEFDEHGNVVGRDEGPPPSYMFSVRAVNAAGEGPAAGPLTRTPLGPDIEISIAADAETATEGEDVVFTLTRIFNPLNQGEGIQTTLDVTVMVSVTESGATISEAPMTVYFESGQEVAQLTVSTDDDMLDEYDSEITAKVVDMSAPGYRPVDAPDNMAMTTVMDDDDAPTATIAATTAGEGSDATASEEIVFTISLDAPSGKEITVEWETGDDASAGMYDMAVADTDYMAMSGMVVFMPQRPAAPDAPMMGETEKTVAIPLTGDALDEHNETFVVSISTQMPKYVTIAEGEMAVGTIEDDDKPPSVMIADMSGDESGNLVFDVTLDAPSGLPIVLDVMTGDVETPDDPYGMATADVDYTAISADTTVDFVPAAAGMAGPVAGMVTVTVTDDMLDEHDEMFGVTLTPQMADYVMVGDGMATGTIMDNDDPPTVSIADGSAAEMDGEVTLGVTLSAPSGLPIGVNYATGDMETPDDMYGMAMADVDYTSGTGMVNFEPGDTEMMVSVVVIDDMLDEHDEVFAVTLSDPSYATVEDGDATGTIMDDDDSPMVSIADASADEADGQLTFAVTLDAPSALPIGVNYATGDMETPDDMYGMATADVDYTSGTGTVNFEPGETEMMVTVTVMDDMLDEHDEMFSVMLSEAGYATIDDGMATGTIMDDDDSPMVSIADASADEADGQLTFAVTLDAPSALPIGVNYATGDMETPDDMYGMATADVDYTSGTGTVNFEPGETEMMVTVTVMDDMLDEHDEMFSVMLSEAGYATIDDGMATGTIMDDDDSPMVSIADASADEADGQLTFAVTLDAPSALPIGVNYATGDMETPDDMYGMATADVDYTSGTGTVNFEPGETEMMVTVTVMDDMLDEHDEMFSVMLSEAGYATIDDGMATGTIMDDDDSPALTVADASAAESTGQIVFTVSLDAPSGLPVGVDYSTGDIQVPDGSYTMAMVGVDYTAANGMLEFEPGMTELTVEVALLDDALDEKDEQFAITLSNSMYGNFAADADAVAAIGTIMDDDDAPTMSIGDASGNEAVGQLMFAVTLSAPSGLPIAADYATAPGTAMAGEDYETASGTLDIAPGGTSTMIAVTVVADDVHEAEETFTVNLSGAMYSTLDDASAVGTIADDDPPPTLAIADSTASESAGQMTFTVTKSGATALPASVAWATSSGTATAGEDYTESSGTLNFAPGENSMTLSVPIMADDRYEGEEHFTVTLSGSSNSTLDDASATGTITDDDAEAVVQAWLARFGRTVASHVVDAVGGRLTGEPSTQSSAQLRLGGYAVGSTGVWDDSSPRSFAGHRSGMIGDPLFNPIADRGSNPAFDPTFGQAWGGGTQGPWAQQSAWPGARNNGFGNLLSRSSFHFSAAGSNPGDSFALWGRGATTSFSGDDGALSHDGDVSTGSVGVDFETGETVFGIGMSLSQGEGEFAGSGSGLAGGTLDSSLTLFHPYVRVNLNECTSIWGLVGTGSGELTLTNGDGGAAIDTDIEMTMGAAGFRGPLLVGLGDFGLEVKSDVFVANMSADGAPGLESVDADASRVRVALHGSNTTELEGGGLFTPLFEAGLRYDGGDAETGAGVEIGGGMRFSDASRRVSLQLNARALLAHSESEYEEWGLGAAVVVHPNASGQGVTFNLRSAWGEVASGVDALWSRYDAAALVDRGERSLARRIGARYDAELGYGINAPGGRNILVPFVAAGVSDIGTRDYRMGLRLRSDANMDFSFEVDRREGLGFEPDHGVVLRGWLFW